MSKRIKTKPFRKKYLNVEYYRKKYGIPREAISTLLGFTLSNYSLKENGKVPFTLNEAVHIWRVINSAAKKEGDPPLSMEEIFGIKSL